MPDPLAIRVAKLERKMRVIEERHLVEDALVSAAQKQIVARTAETGRRYSLAELAFAALVGASSVATTLHTFFA